jgi:hypothetical protein
MKLVTAGIVGLWLVVSSVLLVRNEPKTVLIGIDQYGTRVIAQEDDRLLLLERGNFVKRFLSLAYTYNSTDFEDKITAASDMMSEDLWKERRSDFLRLKERLSKDELLQRAKVLEIREIDKESFEADLELTTSSGMKKASTKLRIEIRLKKVRRTTPNPYPFEVQSYVETIIS